MAAVASLDTEPDHFATVRAMNRMSAAGFDVRAAGDSLRISPIDRLSDSQRAYLRAHKVALVALLSDADDLHRALVQAGTDGLDWREGAPADWSDDRLLAAGEVLYSTGRMVSRHDRRYAAECAPPPGPDIPPDISTAPSAETTSATTTWADKGPDIASAKPAPPADPLAARVAELIAQGWSPWNARARAEAETNRPKVSP